jgi:hypothetical protein
VDADLQNPCKSANPFGGPTDTRRPHASWASALNVKFRRLGPKKMLVFNSLKHQITELEEIIDMNRKK